MSVMKNFSKLSKNGCDGASLDYISENYNEIERERTGDEYKESKKPGADPDRFIRFVQTCQIF